MSDDIKIKVGVQSGVKSGMDKVSTDLSSAMSGIKSAFGMLGIGLGFGAAIGYVKNLISSLGELKDAAANVNFGTQNYQKLIIVAGEAGIKADEMSAALGKMQKAQESVSSDPKIQKAFRDLGISIDDALSANPEQLFEMIARGLAKTGDKAAIFDIFGRGASKLIPTLRELAGGFDAINKAGMIDDAALDKLDAVDEKFQTINRTLKSILVSLADKLFKYNFGAILGAWSAGGTAAEGIASINAPDSADGRAAKAREAKKADDAMSAAKRKADYAISENQRILKDQIDSEIDMDQFEDQMLKDEQDRDHQRAQDKIKLHEFERKLAADTAKTLLEIDKKAIQDQERKDQREIQAIQRKINFLKGLAELEQKGAEQADIMANPDNAAAQRKADRAHDRDVLRKANMEDRANEMLGRGVKLPKNMADFLDARNNQRIGEQAKLAAENLQMQIDKQWRLKQEAAADAMIRIDKQISQIAAP